MPLIKPRLLQIWTRGCCCALYPWPDWWRPQCGCTVYDDGHPWRIRSIHEYNNRLVPRQTSRDPHGLKKKSNRQRRSRGPPSHSLLPGMCAFDRYILTSIPGGHFERSGAPVRSASTSYNSILFRSALSNSLSFWVPSSANCRLCILFPCSPASPPLQVLFTCVVCQLPVCAGPTLLPHHRDLRATACACCRLRRSPRQIPSPAWHGTPSRTCLTYFSLSVWRWAPT